MSRIVATLVAAALFAASSPALARDVTVPVNVGLGPAFYSITGPIADEQSWHYGARLSLQAIIDQETIEENIDMVPRQYRDLLEGVEELRVSPLIYVPESLIISPRIDDTMMFGATWQPISLGLPLIRTPVRLALEVGAILTYAYIDSCTLFEGGMHFFRPGLDFRADLEIPLTQSFLISIGWDSQVHIPQELGGGLLDIGDSDTWAWHFGQAYAMVHVRFPYTLTL